MITISRMGVLLCACFISIFSKGQTSVTFPVIQDAEIIENPPTTSLGSMTNLLVRPWVPGNTSRVVLMFDLSSLSGCTIESAKLSLFERNTFGVARTLDLHTLTTAWTEAAVSWASPWTSSGGDFSAISNHSFTPSWTGVPKYDSVDVQTDVQAFVDGTIVNNGWLIKISVEDGSQQFWEFYAKEWVVAAQRPTLTVTYSGCSALPIELLAFDAFPFGDNVKCPWNTASETNNDFFTVERSKDAMSFTAIGVVDGSGTTSESNSYEYVDAAPYQGLSYYRLKQTDFSGTYSYSETKAVYRAPMQVVNIYPNPAESETNIVIGSDQDTPINVQVYNSIGQIKDDFHDEIFAGHTTVSLGTESYSSGLYLFRITTPSGEQIESVFVRK